MNKVAEKAKFLSNNDNINDRLFALENSNRELKFDQIDKWSTIVRDLITSQKTTLKSQNLLMSSVSKIAEIQKEQEQKILTISKTTVALADAIGHFKKSQIEPTQLQVSITNEIESRTKRSKNILLLNVTEPTSDTSFRRRNIDNEFAHNLIRQLETGTSTNIQRVHRIGRWEKHQAVGSKIRPLLIELKNSNQRDVVLQHAYKLCDTGNIRITADYTNSQRSIVPIWTATRGPNAVPHLSQPAKNLLRPQTNTV